MLHITKRMTPHSSSLTLLAKVRISDHARNAAATTLSEGQIGAWTLNPLSTERQHGYCVGADIAPSHAS